MDNSVMLGLQAAVAAAAVDASAGMTAVPEGGESFSSVLAAQTGQTGQTGQTVQTVQDVQNGSEQAVQKNIPVTDGQAADGSVPVSSEAADVIDGLSGKDEDGDGAKSALDVILNILDSTEDDGTLKGMKILAKAVLNAMMGDNGAKKKKTDLFAFMGEGYEVFADDYALLLTGTEMLDQIGAALKKDLAAAEDAETEIIPIFVSDPDAEEEVMSPVDEIISKLDKIVKKLCSADDDIDENAAAEMLAAMLGIPADANLDYVLAPVKEQALEAAAEVLSAPKKIVAEESPEDVPEMERLYSELTVKYEKNGRQPEAEQTNQSGVHEAFKASFTAVKINNAANQLRAINGEEIPTVPEAAAAVPNLTAVRTDIGVPAETEASAEIGADPVEIESQVTEKISERLFEMKEDNGTEELIMVLKPENLGQVAVKLVKENGAVSVLLSAQYEEVGKLMAERAANLGGSLQSRDVQVKDVNVVDPSSAAEQMGLSFTDRGFGFERSFGGSSDTGGRGSRGTGSAESVEGIDSADMTENIEIIREAGKWMTIA